MKKAINRVILCFLVALGLSIVLPGSSLLCYADDREESDFEETDIAQVFIVTQSKITDEYMPAIISIVDKKDGTYETIVDEDAQIKLRGNSTAKLSKHPYNFKLSSSQSVLGMAADKKWSLLANYLDTSLMRNRLAYSFAQDIGVAYSCNTRYVDVWLNGKYVGNYLLTEPVETGSNRVDIDTDKNEYLFEITVGRVEEEITYINSGIYRFEINEPESPTEEQSGWFSDFLLKAEAAMETGNASTIKQYVDFESFAKFYIVQELFKNMDVHLSSTRFHIKNGKLYAGPIWDFDLSAGNVSTHNAYENYLTYNNYGELGNASQNSYEGLWALTTSADEKADSWMELLMKCEEFSSLYYTKYMGLQGKIQNLYQTNTLGDSQIDLLLKEYGNSFKRDVARWPVSLDRSSELYRAEEKTYAESVSYLRSFLKNRNEWLLCALASYKPSSTSFAPATGSAPQTSSTVLVDGNPVCFEAYNINGNNFFKLRDLAKAVSGSGKQFEVSWDPAVFVVKLESGKPYTAIGKELAKGNGKTKQYTQSNAMIYKDGTCIELSAYNINGNNYVKLRDVATIFNIGVSWDEALFTIKIETELSYTAQ